MGTTKLELHSIVLPEMAGKMISEVHEYLKKIYGPRALTKRPGHLEYWPLDLSRNSRTALMDGYSHYLFGSVFRRRGEPELEVPNVRWKKDEFIYRCETFQNKWMAHWRIVLYDKRHY